MGAMWRPDSVNAVPTPSLRSMRATSCPPVSVPMRPPRVSSVENAECPARRKSARGIRGRLVRGLRRLAEPRQARRQLAERREALVGVDRGEARVELLLRLAVGRIRDAAVDRAHRGAGLLVMEAHALRAELGVDDVDVFALADGAVRALGLAGAAVDAFLGDRRRHRSSSPWARRAGGDGRGVIQRETWEVKAAQIGARPQLSRG